MPSETNPGMSPDIKPDELSVLQADLAEINRILENAEKYPSTGKFLNIEALNERKKKLTEAIEKLGSTELSGTGKYW